jgi:hypothetical protein
MLPICTIYLLCFGSRHGICVLGVSIFPLFLLFTASRVLLTGTAKTHHARIQIIMTFVHPMNVPVAQVTMDTVTIFNIIKWKTKNINLFCRINTILMQCFGI